MKKREIINSLGKDKVREIDLSINRLMRIKRIRLQKRLKRLNVIIRRGKLGLDTAHKFAYNLAIKKGYTNLITMDADLSHDPIKINKMIKKYKACF